MTHILTIFDEMKNTYFVGYGPK